MERASPHAPATAEWWPSQFGPDDQIGMLNHVDDAKRAAALSLVRTGRLYDLSHELHEDIPVFPGRYFRQTLVTTAHQTNVGEEGMLGDGVGDNDVNWVIDIVSGTQQLGTHLDALCHLQMGNRSYNGFRVSALAEPWGMKKLGAETAPQIVTRGLLVDVSSEEPAPGFVIGIEHVERALGGLEPEPGDALLFHTGWSAHWEDPDAYVAGEPGPGVELAEWLAGRGVALTGCDTWSYGPVPPEDPARPFEVPQTLNVRHGVFIVENLATAELAADGVVEFALILTHPKLRGATGAWTSPIALV
jgi:kynurenine formamidase